jgi:preprotein translocase subunit SecY
MKFPGLLKKAALAVGGLAFFEIGARIGLPGVNLSAVANALSQGPRNGLLGLYNLLGGGALSRGAVLALGIVPYISASIVMRLARVVSPTARALNETPDGHDRLTRWTRALTLALAAIQGYGFASFLQNIPGAVANPGFGFTAQTMLILTAGSGIAMMITEKLFASEEDEEDDVLIERTLLEEGVAPAVPLQTSSSIGSRVQ